MDRTEFSSRIISLSPRLLVMVERILGNRDDAEDAIQEIMYKLWKKRKYLGKHTSPEGYAFVAAKNYCLDKKKKRRIYTTEIKEIYSATESEKILDDNETVQNIKKIINELPDKQKEIITHRDLEGLEFTEIAEITGLTVENVRVRLSRARKTISRRMNELYNYEYGELKRSS